jgi:hypothetical protein
MCIISGPVTSVNSTKLLCLPSKNRKRQLTIYSNKVMTQEANIMCLPVPNPHSVNFEQVPKDIFVQCEDSFDYMLSRSDDSDDDIDDLPIISHGSYEVVLLHSMKHFGRIPAKFNILTSEVIHFLQQSYTSEFGLLLCRLKEGYADYEPFAYSHDIQSNGSLFFPTKHYHVHSTNHSNVGSTNVDKYAYDWDHDIYSICTDVKQHSSPRKRIQSKNNICWDDIPTEFQLGSDMSMRCNEIVDKYLNVDIQMPIVY